MSCRRHSYTRAVVGRSKDDAARLSHAAAPGPIGNNTNTWMATDCVSPSTYNEITIVISRHRMIMVQNCGDSYLTVELKLLSTLLLLYYIYVYLIFQQRIPHKISATRPRTSLAGHRTSIRERYKNSACLPRKSLTCYESQFIMHVHRRQIFMLPIPFYCSTNNLQINQIRRDPSSTGRESVLAIHQLRWTHLPLRQ